MGEFRIGMWIGHNGYAMPRGHGYRDIVSDCLREVFISVVDPVAAENLRRLHRP